MNEELTISVEFFQNFAFGSGMIVSFPKHVSEGYGATLVYCDPTPAARASTCAEISQRENYEIIPPYDHHDVIAGQGTIGIEFLSQVSRE